MNALGSTSEVLAVVARRLSTTVRAEQESTQAVVPAARRRLLAEELIDGEIKARRAAAGIPVQDDEAVTLAKSVADSLFAMGGLEVYLQMPDVENINTVGNDEVYLRFADGHRERGEIPVADSDAELIALIRTVAARAGHEERRFDRDAPLLSLQLPDGSRLFAVMAVTKRPCISIRRHRYTRATLEQLIELGTLNHALADFLAASVRARMNVLIAGGPAVGKTTLLRALAAEIDPWERLITIEDALELGLGDADRPGEVIEMQSREKNIEGKGALTQSDLVKASLRMSPDRVIVGEIRGAEVIAMANAMSNGLDGSMSTVHTSVSAGVFAKLANYAAQAPERLDLYASNQMIANAVHLVVQLAQSPDKRRVVSSIREVTGFDGNEVASNELFHPGPDRRALPHIRPSDARMEQLIEAGWAPGSFRRAR